jgi:hypothetical protein
MDGEDPVCRPSLPEGISGQLVQMYTWRRRSSSPCARRGTREHSSSFARPQLAADCLISLVRELPPHLGPYNLTAPSSLDIADQTIPGLVITTYTK